MLNKRRRLNEELKRKDFITIAGRVRRKYYEEKFYGMAPAGVRRVCGCPCGAHKQGGRK